MTYVESINKAYQGLKGKTIKEIEAKMCGEKLGSGKYRDVYVLKQNPKYVVKIERDPSKGTFANVTEWRNYIDNKEFKFLSDWMAPCYSINETGQVLIQRRIKHGRRKDYPKLIPGYFTDLKLSNFGWIGKKFVCCDYSFLRLVPKKMRCATWWGTLKGIV